MPRKLSPAPFSSPLPTPPEPSRARLKDKKNQANLISGMSPKSSIKRPQVTENARKIADVLISQCRDLEVAELLRASMPGMVQATMDAALGQGPAAMQSRQQLMRWAAHPAATVADQKKSSREAGGALMDRLAQALSRPSGKVIEAESEPVGHANGTPLDVIQRRPAFPVARRG